jgi:hypothetical protein
VLSSLVSRSDRSSKIRVLIAEDTYLQLALLGYILTHEISTERLDQTLTANGAEAILELV